MTTVTGVAPYLTALYQVTLGYGVDGPNDEFEVGSRAEVVIGESPMRALNKAISRLNVKQTDELLNIKVKHLCPIASVRGFTECHAVAAKHFTELAVGVLDD